MYLSAVHPCYVFDFFVALSGLPLVVENMPIEPMRVSAANEVNFFCMPAMFTQICPSMCEWWVGG